LVYQLGAGAAFALLVIKEVRHWTTSILIKKTESNGSNGSHRYTIMYNQGERIKANETEISNIKELSKEQRKENKSEHDTMVKENKSEHDEMKKENKDAHEEIKALIINGGGK